MLKDKSTDTALFVVIIQLVPIEQAKEEAGALDANKKLEETHGGKEEAKEISVGGDDDELD